MACNLPVRCYCFALKMTLYYQGKFQLVTLPEQWVDFLPSFGVGLFALSQKPVKLTPVRFRFHVHLHLWVWVFHQRIRFVASLLPSFPLAGFKLIVTLWTADSGVGDLRWICIDSVFFNITKKQNTGSADTVLADTTGSADQMSKKATILEENLLAVFTGFEDTTALEDKKDLTVFSA